MMGKIEGRRRRGLQMTRWLNAINDSMDMSLGEQTTAGKRGLKREWRARKEDMDTKSL